MLPFFTATTCLLLLVCCIEATRATKGDNASRISQPAVLLETKVEEAGSDAREAINMTLFKWSYNETNNETQLTICTQNSLLVVDEEIINNITLVYENEERRITNIAGQVLGENTSCSLFIEEGNIPLAKKESSYRLGMVTTKGKTTFYKFGVISFGMPVKTSTLTCHGKSYTRATGLTNDITFYLHDCFKNDQGLDDEGVCYIEGEFSSSYLCYTTNATTELQVCLQGSSLTTADEVPPGDGQLTINYLAYAGVLDSDDAQLSLEFQGHDATDCMEAIIWNEDHFSATSCLNTSCSIPDFTSGFVLYDVCSVILVDNLPYKTSTDTITDLDADAYAYNGSPLMQFNYTNANNERYYMANLVNITSFANATVDCSAVPSNKTCHGYFEAECGGDLMVAVEYYSNDEKVTKGNKIIFPCRPIPEQ